MGFWKRFRESLERQGEENRKKHPYDVSFFTKFIFHNRSDQPASMQIIDLLYDIRGMLLFIAIAILLT